MGRKKSFVKIPKIVKIRCINCEAVSKRKAPLDSSPQYFDCQKCGQRMTTPVAFCCIICAFTKQKCAPSLIMEAKIRGLEVR